jgi:hypothetical protein
MKFEVPKKAAGYMPEVFLLLNSLNDDFVFSDEHQLSHPVDIFSLTFGDAMDCIYVLAKSVNDETENVMYGGKTSDERLSEIRRQIFDLLFYTSNFVEGCQSIIKSIFPNGDKRLSKAARDFRGNVKEYTFHASQLINKVKHQHRRPRTFTFAYENKIIIGYYLDGLVDKGVLGPDPELHRPYKGFRTGFSLNRVIPYHLCNLYYVSACLASVVKGYVKVDGLLDTNYEDKRFRETFAEVAKIPCMLLPDEMEMPIPVVKCKSDGGYRLEFPGRNEVINKKIHKANVSLEARIGVRDRGIAPPYMFSTKN